MSTINQHKKIWPFQQIWTKRTKRRKLITVKLCSLSLNRLQDFKIHSLVQIGQGGVECKQILVMNSCWVFLFACLRIIVCTTVLFQLLLISNLHWMKQGGSGKRASTAVYAVGLGWPVEPVGLNWLEPDGPKGENTGRGDIVADALCICITSCWKCTTSSRIFLISPRITWSTPRDIWSSVCALGVWGLLFWTFVFTAKSIFELKIVSAYLHVTKPTKTKKLILHIYPSKVQGAVFS